MRAWGDTLNREKQFSGSQALIKRKLFSGSPADISGSSSDVVHVGDAEATQVEPEADWHETPSESEDDDTELEDVEGNDTAVAEDNGNSLAPLKQEAARASSRNSRCRSRSRNREEKKGKK